MVNSMTGYGRYEASENDRKITVEIKSVNNRHLDLGIKMPRRFNVFEAGLRSIASSQIKRGKVDIYISYEDKSAGAIKVDYNLALAGEYMRILDILSKEFGIENEISAASLSRFPEVITYEDSSEIDEELKALVENCLRGALDDFVFARRREGEYLKKDIVDKLSVMRKNVDFITKKSPDIVAKYKADLRAKVEEALGGNSIDENRIITEVTIFADKTCVDEELVRLSSHMDAMEKILSEAPDDEAIGRKLDFIAQEMNRESNTILSKSSDFDVSDAAIELKTDVEKIREQVQNIE